ncbi:ATP-binding protein [Aliarcobacter butzleri]|uniref:ATP-binding protein n=1 Tax=Aliarcobacter butzleri TaxID=28197 RepID=UPI00125EB4E0|nr:ATP-binding protein [Aliarcobacter butzleri]
MELVYLWVESYKNIEKQGFNFSPRFRCEYDENTKELNILDKEETGEFYPKNFFGDNINVTAIVGENGSGKSSLISLFMEIIYSKVTNNYILVFNNGYSSNIENISTSLNKMENITKEILYNIVFDFSLGDGYILNQKNEDYKKNYSLEPSRNYYSGSMGGISKIENQSYNATMYANAIYFFRYFDTSIIKYLKLPLFNKLKYISITKIGNIHKEKAVLQIIKKSSEVFKNDLLDGILEENIQQNMSRIIQTLTEKVKNLTFEDFFDKDYLLIQEDILLLFKFKFIDDNNLDFTLLSKGQQQIISYFGILARLKRNFADKNNINIFFDEVESTFHPDWQRNFINLLIQLIVKSNLLNNGQKINLVFATHSPFILSDLPKENIIFLEKGKQVYPFEDGKQTFGANIHTLLSHGFFMKDGLMGEFAKDKIQLIIKYHEDIEKKEIIEADKIEYKTKKQKEFWQIQSIIGDDYLKQVIKNHLIEIEKIVLGNHEAKEEEIKRLKAQIELLEK